MRVLACVAATLIGAGLVAAQGGGVTAKQGKAAFDASNAKIEFVGSKPQGKHDGGFKKFTGTLQLAPTGKGLAGVTVDIDTDSLWSDNPKLTGHLKTGDFFDVKRYPKAGFVSTRVTEGGKDGATHTITGKLTLHGETKEISIPATVRVNGGAVSLRSQFSIDRTQFGMTYGRGKVEDTVQIKVAIGK